MERTAIVTSALPYANGEIHLGHVASTYLPADATVRYLRQRGAEAYYVCATDDYGTPILVQSGIEGKEPPAYVAEWNRRDAEDFASLGIRFDAFSSTSSPACVGFAQESFKKLQDAGHVYEKDVVQPYCERDSMFLPDRYVRGTCPYCSAADQYSDLCESCGKVPEEILDPRCSICGDRPQKRTTPHYFFALSHFADRLREWLESDELLQADVKRYVLGWISQGLSDWDITRDISWGVPIPGDSSGRVLYGWFDNHLAYISATAQMLESRGIAAREFWNSAQIYHFVGKDIVYHHYLFLPAVRMGLDLEFKLPDHMPVRGHLMLGGKKISKSRGPYIGLRDFVARYPADYLRFYLLLVSSYSQDDHSFEWADFGSRINSELVGNIGNFVNRSLSFTARSFGGRVPEPDAGSGLHEEARAQMGSLAAKTGELIDAGHLDRALRHILGFSAHFNQYFQHCEPWKRGAGSAACIHLSVNAVRSLAVVLYPFVPSAAQNMWSQLGLEGDVSAAPWESASEAAIGPGHAIGTPEILFSKVDAKDADMTAGSAGDDGAAG